jgi:precorrin-2 dehydrogenase/sirohydrochlorin ferrochelatase
MAEGQGYFPVFLKLQGAKAVVVGGGRIALRKCRDLLAAGARVHAVAPDFCAQLKRLSSVKLCERPFHATDVRGAALVIAATDSPEVNARVAAEARRRGIHANVVDNPKDSTFIVPAVLRRGLVVIAVSTSGASPALARNLRDMIGHEIDPGVGRHAAFLRRARAQVLNDIADARARRRILERLAEDDVREMIRSAGLSRAKLLLQELTREAERSRAG